MLAGRMHFHLVALELVQLLPYRRLQGGQKSRSGRELRASTLRKCTAFAVSLERFQWNFRLLGLIKIIKCARRLEAEHALDESTN